MRNEHDAEIANENYNQPVYGDESNSEGGVKRTLKQRHMAMIALGELAFSPSSNRQVGPLELVCSLDLELRCRAEDRWEHGSVISSCLPSFTA